MGSNGYACIIPFYNERDRILSVLSTINHVAGLGPIICVDDGSIDGGSVLVETHFPNVKLVRLDQNHGKTGAIRQAIRLVETEYVCLLDADLRLLTTRDVESALLRISLDPFIDMIILRRCNADLNSKITRGDVLFSGERILKTTDLEQVLNGNPVKYQLEIAINHYMMKNNKRVYWMPSSALNTLKIKKVGLFNGIEQDMVMIKNMLDFGGLGVYMKQLFEFATEQIPE